jgi:putative spermidine/putrescine transport system ATP-binding protein
VVDLGPTVPASPPREQERQPGPGHTPPAVLAVTGLVKRYGNVTAVAGVDLTMRTGECLVLLGPSGSGKTTILKIIAGFELATSGRVLLDGRDISRLPPSARGIGMVFQNYALFPHLTVAQNVAYGLRMRRWPADRQRERVAEMLDLVRLPGLGSRRPRELSGGQQQRVALARALAFSPRLLLMDEPLGALDRALRVEMEHEIRRIQQEVGATVLYVTHDQEEAMALADRVGIIRNGRLLACDTPQALYEQPPSAFSAAFFGERNVLPAQIREILPQSLAQVHCLGQECQAMAPRPPGSPDCVLTFLPSAAQHEKPDENALRLSFTVTEALYLGYVTQVRGTLPNGLAVTVRLPRRPAPDGSLPPASTVTPHRGAQLEVFVPAHSLLVLDNDLNDPGAASGTAGSSTAFLSASGDCHEKEVKLDAKHPAESPDSGSSRGAGPRRLL